MGLNREEILRKIAASSVSGGGVNLLDGRYRFAIKRMALESGFKGARFVIDMVVMHSQKKPVTELKTGKQLDITPNPPGSDVNFVFMLEEHESAFGNIKGCILALYGESEDGITKEELYGCLDDLTAHNAAKGMIIDCDSYRKVTKTNKVEIVVPKWTNIAEQDVPKVCAWLDSLTTGPAVATA